ncbi:MAG: hypothetical protein V7K47_03610 [Nostoc sp.]
MVSCQRVAGVPPVVATSEPEGCRRLSKDYERLPETSETFIHIAMIPFREPVG